MRSAAAKASGVLLVMGVAGSGKTTIGRRIARRLGWSYVEADEAHPAANIAKMRAGIPLQDDDRGPWLDAVRTRIERDLEAGDGVVLACSALRRAYRARLLEGLPRTAVVHLDGDRRLLDRRLRTRSGHFMPADLLDSQLATLEPPEPIGESEPLRFGRWDDRALAVDVEKTEQEVVKLVTQRLALSE